MEIDYKIFIAAGIITLALFGLIYTANEIANSQREQKINDMRDEVIDELESIKAFTAISSLIGEEENCNLIQSQLKYFDKSIWDIGIKLDSYKEASKNIFDDPFYQKQKKRFVVNQVLYLSMLEKMKQTCNTSMPITILYFYGNSKECKMCDDQSFVLTDLNRKYDEALAIFSLDLDMDISATTVLADYYNVSKETLPCLVIDKSASCGFMDKNMLATKINNMTGFVLE